MNDAFRSVSFCFCLTAIIVTSILSGWAVATLAFGLLLLVFLVDENQK